MELAAKRVRFRLAFSAEGTEEIRAMCERLLANLRLAVAVFMTGDPHAAAKLIPEKKVFRELERHATETHFIRLRKGSREGYRFYRRETADDWLRGVPRSGYGTGNGRYGVIARSQRCRTHFHPPWLAKPFQWLRLIIGATLPTGTAKIRHRYLKTPPDGGTCRLSDSCAAG
ncbi:hypothetical protein [Inquilinus sp.]|uniref:hypothetical protein n=1 Tax=Inquilinus sp. TaxID=1932117 RepID=UPI0031D65DF2